MFVSFTSKLPSQLLGISGFHQTVKSQNFRFRTLKNLPEPQSRYHDNARPLKFHARPLSFCAALDPLASFQALLAVTATRHPLAQQGISDWHMLIPLELRPLLVGAPGHEEASFSPVRQMSAKGRPAKEPGMRSTNLAVAGQLCIHSKKTPHHDKQRRTQSRSNARAWSGSCSLPTRDANFESIHRTARRIPIGIEKGSTTRGSKHLLQVWTNNILPTQTVVNKRHQGTKQVTAFKEDHAKSVGLPRSS